jgi:hypothetical protein
MHCGLRIRVLLVVALVVASAFVSASSAAAGTLAGETFSGAPSFWALKNCDPVDQTATSQSFHYRAEGLASGPHPGTFVETGKVELGEAAEGLFRPVLSLKAHFVIRDVDGNVTATGKKRLIEALPFSDTTGGACVGPAEQPFLVIAALLEHSVCYEARFSDGGREVGRSQLGVVGSLIIFTTFFEDFTPDPSLDC